MTLAGRPVPVLIAAIVACAALVSGAMMLAPVLGGALAGWSPAGQEALFALILYGALAAVGFAGGGWRRSPRRGRPRCGSLWAPRSGSAASC